MAPQGRRIGPSDLVRQSGHINPIHIILQIQEAFEPLLPGQLRYYHKVVERDNRFAGLEKVALPPGVSFQSGWHSAKRMAHSVKIGFSFFPFALYALRFAPCAMPKFYLSIMALVISSLPTVFLNRTDLPILDTVGPIGNIQNRRLVRDGDYGVLVFKLDQGRANRGLVFRIERAGGFVKY